MFLKGLFYRQINPTDKLYNCIVNQHFLQAHQSHDGSDLIGPNFQELQSHDDPVMYCGGVRLISNYIFCRVTTKRLARGFLWIRDNYYE